MHDQRYYKSYRKRVLRNVLVVSREQEGRDPIRTHGGDGRGRGGGGGEGTSKIRVHRRGSLAPPFLATSGSSRV